MNKIIHREKMKKIIAATNNKGKIREIKSVLCDFEVYSLVDAGINLDTIEDGASFEENALKKAKECASLAADAIVIADDSGLCVDYLKGAPGIYSARYAGENADDNMRINKLLCELEGVEDNRRTARFVCAIACILPNGDSFTVRGECEGIICNKPLGENGFGYDPIFLIPHLNKTFAQLSADEKNEISHRANALERLKGRLENI